MKVGELFEFPLKYISLDMNNAAASSIDYAAIFARQREEFVEKSVRHGALARHLSSRLYCDEELAGNGGHWLQFPSLPPETATGAASEKILCVDCGRDFLSEEMLQSKHLMITKFCYNMMLEFEYWKALITGFGDPDRILSVKVGPKTFVLL
jgi:hypothetical protein